MYPIWFFKPQKRDRTCFFVACREYDTGQTEFYTHDRDFSGWSHWKSDAVAFDYKDAVELAAQYNKDEIEGIGLPEGDPRLDKYFVVPHEPYANDNQQLRIIS